MLVGISGLSVLGRVVLASTLAFAPAASNAVPETTPPPGKPDEPDTLQADPSTEPTDPAEASAEPVEPDEAPAEPVEPDQEPAEPAEPESEPASEESAEPESEQAEEGPTEPEPSEPERAAVGIETAQPRPSRPTAARGDLLRTGLLGGGTAALLVGAGLAGAMIWSLSEWDAEGDLDAQPYLRSEDPGRRDRMQNIAIGTGVAAAAYLLTGAVLVGFGARLQRPRTWGVSPTASGQGAGLRLGGRF